MPLPFLLAGLGASAAAGTLAPAVIGATASLAGGLIDKGQRNKELAMQDPAYIRERAEAAGFNPLTVLNSGALAGLNYSPTFGDSIARAGAIVTDTMLESQALEVQRGRLEVERQNLERLRKQTMLTVNRGGIYAQDRQANRPDSPAGVFAPADFLARDRQSEPLEFGFEAETVAPGRVVRTEPYSNIPGVVGIDNPLTGGAVVLPGNDEPWGVDELATAILLGTPQVAANHMKNQTEKWGDDDPRSWALSAPALGRYQVNGLRKGWQWLNNLQWGDAPLGMAPN